MYYTIQGGGPGGGGMRGAQWKRLWGPPAQRSSAASSDYDDSGSGYVYSHSQSVLSLAGCSFL
jgi:hypothetical protein